MTYLCAKNHLPAAHTTLVRAPQSERITGVRIYISYTVIRAAVAASMTTKCACTYKLLSQLIFRTK